MQYGLRATTLFCLVSMTACGGSTAGQSSLLDGAPVPVQDDTSGFLLGDAAGGGMAAIVQVYKGAAGEAEASLFRSTGQGFAPVDTTNLGNQFTGVFRLGDVTGDKLADLVQLYEGAAGEVEASLFQATGQGFSPVSTTNLGNSYVGVYLLGDVDGDGRADVVQIYQGAGGEAEASFFRSTGNGFAPVGTTDLGNTFTGTFLLGDVDGDGRADIVQIYQGASGEAEASYFRSTGNGFAPIGTTDLGNSFTGTFLLGDVNGDGRADLVQVYQGAQGEAEASIFLSTGDGFGPLGTTDLGNTYTGVFRLGDVTGDRLADVVQVYAGASHEAEASLFESTSRGFAPVNTTDLGNTFTP